MRPTISVRILSLGALVVLGAYGLNFSAARSLAPWFLATGTTLVLAGLGSLGAGPRAPRLVSAVLVASACTLIGFAVALRMPPHEQGGAQLLGLPRATTLLLLVSGGIPLVLLPAAYAWAFPREVPTEVTRDD